MNIPFLSDVQDCALDRWSPGIGDPTVTGWVTVLVYLLAAVVAGTVARRGSFPGTSRGRERLFWTLLTMVPAALAINKQLDLQSYVTAVGRCIAQAQGWYDSRRVVQVRVILGMLAAMLVVALGLWRMMRDSLRRNAVALIGVILVLAFVAVRAVGFNHLDALINMRVLNLRLNWLFELTGPGLIIFCGIRILWPQRAASHA